MQRVRFEESRMEDFIANTQISGVRLMSTHMASSAMEQGKRDLAQSGVLRMLEFLGEDTGREGLIDTPARHIRYLEDFCNVPDFKFTTFKNEGMDEMIVQSNIDFVSLCEHHLLPFVGVGAIAYIPNENIVGLSKLARTLEKFSRRLQNQERITTQIADFLEQQLSPQGVAVLLSARHLCMEIRGVRKAGSQTTTSCLRGLFKSDPRARKEFFDIVAISK